MNSEVVKGRPLSKDETKALLEMIEKSRTITTKTTNATNNKLKTEEWYRITERFNATVNTSCRRTPQQLRLKWENLKKNARKYSTKIRMNRIKTGGGAAEYIPPDDILDRVSSLLGSTVGGFTVPFGGDREPEGDGGDGVSLGDGARVLHVDDILDSVGDTNPVMSLDNNVIVDCKLVESSEVVVTPNKPKYLTFNTPRTGMKKSKPDVGQTARNNAIAEYYSAKKKCLEGKIDSVLLHNQNLKLENQKLLLEIEKLKLEILKLNN